ncbi:Uncharacterized protein PHSC3_001307 [Chlamydiales bacterium STE3]|nr:Uncharacterized protein PHSC3_001307 [Chlamydiales bacterium STE3]
MLNTMHFFLFIFAFSISLAGENPPLKIGIELSYPPFEMIDQEGHPAGISVEVAKALAKELQRPPLIENIPFIGLIPSLRTGKIDLVISSLSITEVRKSAIDFSNPYLTTGLCLLVSKKSSIQKIEDANQKGIAIAVKSGTSGETYAREHLPLANIVILDKEAACVLEVVQGKADAFIYDQFSVFTNWQKNLGTTSALLEPFKKEQWAIGVQKGNTKLLEEINAFLKKFHQEGGFEQLGDRYLSEQKAAFKKLNIPFVF